VYIYTGAESNYILSGVYGNYEKELENQPTMAVMSGKLPPRTVAYAIIDEVTMICIQTDTHTDRQTDRHATPVSANTYRQTDSCVGTCVRCRHVTQFSAT